MLYFFQDGELSDNVFSDLENSLNKSRKQRNDSTSTSTSTSNGDDFHNANDRGKPYDSLSQ